MIWNSTGVLIFLSISAIVASSSERPVDCRKFVFAPLCRGVAAKRGYQIVDQTSPAIYVNAKTLKEFLKHIHVVKGVSPTGGDETDGDEDESLFGKSLKQRQHPSEDAIFRFLQSNRRIFGEAPGTSVAAAAAAPGSVSSSSQDFDNL